MLLTVVTPFHLLVHCFVLACCAVSPGMVGYIGCWGHHGVMSGDVNVADSQRLLILLVIGVGNRGLYVIMGHEVSGLGQILPGILEVN